MGVPTGGPGERSIAIHVGWQVNKRGGGWSREGLSSTLNLYPGEGRARTLGPVEQGLGSNSQAQRPGRGVKGWAETRSEGGIWTLP